MNDPDLLLQRLDAIGDELARQGTARALIGFGSVGQELARLDRFSDLDFFVIVAAGQKQRYLDDLGWLTAVSPAAYYFANTPDGYKFLFADGIFCEFAVFEEAELQQIPFAPGRVVWKADGVDAAIGVPPEPPDAKERPSRTWQLGEALTNLYVGLLRDRRGETLSATRFIQHYAVDRLIELAAEVETAVAADVDPFDRARRFEARYPAMTGQMADFMQGYGKNRESALAILTFLDRHFDVNPAMKQAILALCAA